MKSVEFVNKIRKYAVISFLIPLLAINACLLIYKFLGNLDITTFPNFNWDKDEQVYLWDDFTEIDNNLRAYTFTNCPKNNFYYVFTSVDNQVLSEKREGIFPQETWNKNDKLIKELKKNNKIKSVTIKFENATNLQCVKNKPSFYNFLKKLNLFESLLIHTVQKLESGFSEVKNPYIYGEVSISRTARYFPATFIFKPLIILSAFFLFLYWKNNLNLLTILKNQNVITQFSRKFFYFGLLSCIFLALHAAFLGLDFDSKLFDKTRRLIIILFILFEIVAQILLVKNLFELKQKIKSYVNFFILRLKVIFVLLVFIITCVAFSILAFGDPSTGFKHTLEWNYFAFLLFYYLLSRLLWKPIKNQKF
tara:strand:- start:28 stop:1119 length:1092 start_codon:yes stop_codon:yes gene_type:complete